MSSHFYIERARARAGGQRGFLLVETLVAITILIIAVGAISGVASLTFEGYRTAQKNYTAAKIAQEGIELVINKRDNHLNCVSNDPECPIDEWHENLKGTWLVDATEPEQLLPSNRFDNYSTNASHTICFVTAPEKHAGKFGYCSEETGEAIDGNYNRRVEVAGDPSPGYGINKVHVKSIVTWDGNKTYTLEEVLFGAP